MLANTNNVSTGEQEEGLNGNREGIPAVAPAAPVVHDEGRK